MLAVQTIYFGGSSVSNGSGMLLQDRVGVGTEPWPNMRSGLSTHLNFQLGYGSIDIS